MGTRCSSELRRGHIYITMKLILLTVFAAVALAEDAPAETEAAAPAAKAFVYSGHQLNWPGHYGLGYSSQCWGCFGPGHLIGKRSAEAEAEAKPFYGFLPYHGFYGYLPYTVPALPALPALADKETGVAAHPGTATSWTQRSAQGLGRRRRSADPGLLYHPFGYYGYPVYHAVAVAPVVPALTGDGVAAHPKAGTSFVGPTTWGFPAE